MKTKIVPRGLYIGSKRIAETEDEQCEICFNVAAWPDDYIDDAKECAASILRENDIDPDSLFDWLEVEVIDEIARTRFEGKFLKWTVLQRDSLSAEQLEAIDQIYHYKPLSPKAHQAIDVILQWHTVQRDLANPQEKAALCNGIRFATAIEHLKANIAWRKSVAAGDGTSKGGRKSAVTRHGKTGTKAHEHQAAYLLRRSQYPSETKTQSRKAVAKYLKKHYKTIERHTTDEALKGR